MGRRGTYPRADCPECGQRVKVSPSSERILPHNGCKAGGRRIDLYGNGEER